MQEEPPKLIQNEAILWQPGQTLGLGENLAQPRSNLVIPRFKLEYNLFEMGSGSERNG
jgi:hypothetical protein